MLRPQSGIRMTTRHRPPKRGRRDGWKVPAIARKKKPSSQMHPAESLMVSFVVVYSIIFIRIVWQS
ncbi:MAG: hypothetical protein WBQ32_12645 [Ignavibacteriaceae bacterium]